MWPRSPEARRCRLFSSHTIDEAVFEDFVMIPGVHCAEQFPWEKGDVDAVFAVSIHELNARFDEQVDGGVLKVCDFFDPVSQLLTLIFHEAFVMRAEFGEILVATLYASGKRVAKSAITVSTIEI